jgi:nucleoside-diphosphate-sugar epimerase
MKLLVTGATGYIGLELIKKLQNIYALVTLVRESSNTEQLQQLNCTIEYYKDYTDIHEIFKTHKFTGVIHLASNVVVEHSKTDISSLIESNITFGTFLLDACKQNNIEWFINTGTFWQNFEDDKYNPVNLYAATKEAFEKIAKFFSETSSFTFVTIKLNDTFGPNDPRPKVFNLWAKIAKSGELLQMSKGEQVIDISYIDDVISAYMQLINLLNLDANIYNGKTFVVSNKERVTLKELANIFQEATNTCLNIEWGGRPYREREVMLPFTKGIVVPGWEQKYTLKEAIHNTVKEL